MPDEELTDELDWLVTGCDVVEIAVVVEVVTGGVVMEEVLEDDDPLSTTTVPFMKVWIEQW